MAETFHAWLGGLIKFGATPFGGGTAGIWVLFMIIDCFEDSAQMYGLISALATKITDEE